MSYDFTGRALGTDDFEIPGGSKIGDKWVVQGVFGSAGQRSFELNLTNGPERGGWPNTCLHLPVAPGDTFWCSRYFDGRWAGGGAVGAERPFDSDFNGSTTPSVPTGKCLPGGPFLVEVHVQEEGYHITLRSDEEDPCPEIMRFAHRDEVSTSTHVIFKVCSASCTVSKLTLSRETIALSLSLVKTIGLVAHCTDMAGAEVVAIEVEPRTKVEDLQASIVEKLNTTATVCLTLGAQLLTDADNAVTMDELLQRCA